MNLIACKGLIALVLEDLGYSKKRITEILNLIDKRNKEMRIKDLELLYTKSNY